jgi:hypothetical protein
MANIGSPTQGVINVSNVQGNYLEVPMEFNSGGVPIDLTTFDDIRMEIKLRYNTNESPFLVFDLEDGLTISGASNNILTYVLDEAFWNNPTQKFVYDITFKTVDGKRFTYIKGTISNVLTASRL